MNRKEGTKFNFAIVGRTSSIENYDQTKKILSGEITKELVDVFRNAGVLIEDHEAIQHLMNAGISVDATIIYEKTSRDKLIVTEEKMK